MASIIAINTDAPSASEALSPALGTGGLPDFVVHEHTGLLVAPGDSKALAEGIVRLIEDTSLRERMHTHAESVARSDYDSTTYTRRLEALYREVRGGPRGAMHH